jgi:superfamily II DNA or RNA helicase
VFFTESFKSEVIIRQSIGRGLRLHSNKNIVKIYDFIDDFRYKNNEHDWLNYIYRHGMERRKIYTEEKFPFEVQNIRF